MALTLAIGSLPLTTGGYTLVFKILYDEVLFGMSALGMCSSIKKPRVIRVFVVLSANYGARITYARVIVIALVRGNISRGTHFPDDICMYIKAIVI